MKNWPRWRNLKWAIASQLHRTCVVDSSSSRHLSQVGSSINPSLKRCPFRWQCPVNSPTIHLNWSLFNFSRSFVPLAEGPDISSFACLSPVVDSHCFCDFCSSSPWQLSWQLQLRCHRLVQVLWTDIQVLFLPADLLAPLSVELCYVWPVLWGIGGYIYKVKLSMCLTN
jgi:hypothetical protein